VNPRHAPLCLRGSRHGARPAAARRRLEGFPDVTVVNSAFEDWDPPEGARFDLVHAATAWKWVSADVKYAKAAAVLPAGGHLAVWDAGHAPEELDDPTAGEFTASGRPGGTTAESGS
jgi:hypothetical protein